MEEVKITRTRTGIPALWIGGGAYSNTCEFRTVLNRNFRLKKALFIATRGPLACSTAQALVPIREGDLIVQWEGRRDELGNDHVSQPKAYVIKDIKDDTAVVEKVSVPWSRVPRSVIEGADEYHNRDATYFCIQREVRE